MSSVTAASEVPAPTGDAKGDAPSNTDTVAKIGDVELAAVEPVAPAEKKSFISYIFGEEKMTAQQLEDFEKDKITNIPEMTYLQHFAKFLSFGCRAFGGPTVQIAMMKDELVTQEKWITERRYMRAYSMYQVLPGPEAMELACYFGYVAKGRFGAFLGGLGFLLPGVLLMLLFSYIYVTFGLKDKQTQASFKCIQLCVSALIFRGTHKLAESAVKDKKTKAPFNLMCFYSVLFCFLASVIQLNFFISIAVAGFMALAVELLEDHKTLGPYKEAIAVFISCFTIGWYILYVQYAGFPQGSLIGGGKVGDTTIGGLFVLGLIAGLVTFGGAYTTLPFIYTACVSNGGWLTEGAFLDAIAICNALPTPLVSFLVLPGFVGGGIGGAIIITIGVFLPAFSFTIIGHEFFEALIQRKHVSIFLDGVASGVIGLLLQTCFQFLRATVTKPVDACIFTLALYASFAFTHKFTQPLIILTAAIAGQALYA